VYPGVMDDGSPYIVMAYVDRAIITAYFGL